MKIRNLFLIVALLSSCAAQDLPWLQLERGFENELRTLGIRKVPEMALSSFCDQIAGETKRCPESEVLAYLRVRAPLTFGAGIKRGTQRSRIE